MSNEATTRKRNRQNVPAIDSSNDKEADPAPLTKREATLIIHVTENFPRMFHEEDLASSLGWTTQEVRETLEVCAANGFVDGPPDIELPAGATLKEFPVLAIDDLLSPEEQDAAKIIDREHRKFL